MMGDELKGFECMAHTMNGGDGEVCVQCAGRNVRADRSQSMDIQKLQADHAALVDGLRAAVNALSEASIDISDWGSYASPYFQEKHDLAGCIKGYEDQAEVLSAILEKHEQ